MRAFEQNLALGHHLLFPVHLDCFELLCRLAGSPPASLLQAACGTGEYVAALVRHGYSAWGTELDPDLHRAGQELHPKLAAQLIQGDLLEVFDLVRGPFGLVLCLEPGLAGLESLEQVTDVLAQLLDLCLPGGTLLMQTPNFDHLLAEAARALLLAEQHRDDSAGDSTAQFEEPVYVELTETQPHGNSPQMASLSSSELRLYLAPRSAAAEDGGLVELERVYRAAPGEWTDQRLAALTLESTLRTAEGAFSGEDSLLCLTRARLERCLSAALARTHRQGAQIEWLGDYAGTAWAANQAASIVVVH